jgi:23S rRNA pseudouridine1911/1915/1917 synthase
MAAEDGLDFHVSDAEAGVPLIDILAERFADVPLETLRGLLRRGFVEVAGAPCTSPSHEPAAGETISFDVAPGGLPTLPPTPLVGFEVLYEDEAVLVAVKPPGVSVVGERDGRPSEILCAVLHHFAARGEGDGAPRPRIVHRLDKETSGALIVAKGVAAARELGRQFEEHLVEKTYHAIVAGVPHVPEGEVAHPIGARERNRGGRLSAIGGRGARPAETRWRLLEAFSAHSLLEVQPRTGRTHQIRVHLEAVGLPLAVDPVYGGGEALLLSRVKAGYRQKKGQEERPLIDRVTLHAHAVDFTSPATGERVHVEAPPPHDFALALKQLRRWAPLGGARGLTRRPPAEGEEGGRRRRRRRG